MKNMKNKKGFTLLEIIIVIIIVGVLASLALPRFFSTVEFSRSTEALTSLSALRQSMERCYLARSGNYTACVLVTGGASNNLDLEDPATSPNNHFTYVVSGQGAAGYVITAYRNSRDGGGGVADNISITQTSTSVTRAGAGKFSGIQ
jgi:general secretion pathway protein G